ncbi:malonate transporter subunit MadL [Spirosoma sp. SC4-14]|uniref:malonate transporter subunit MadL n=1 Tax=Spirosoma sp. SC4-14 TaxID=3128900 RepID=UPI0030D54A1C
MIIYGVAILAFCYLTGQLAGEWLGLLLGVHANVGGVGFAMLLLVVLNDWLVKKKYVNLETETGILFWNKLYIPIVVAMSATQNVKVAVSSGLIAVVAGIVPVLICVASIPLIAKLATPKNTRPDGTYHPVS